MYSESPRAAYDRFLRMRTLCQRLHLDTSVIRQIKYPNYTTCCICVNVGKPAWHDCIAEVVTQTKSARWNNRYLCQEHMDEVQKVLTLRIAKQKQIKETPYRDLILEILAGKEDWVSHQDLVLAVCKRRHEPNVSSIRRECHALTREGKILHQRLHGKSLFKLAESSSTQDRIN